MDKEVIFEKAKGNDNSILYEPDGEHENFNVFANEEEKVKETYSLINKTGYCVGKFISFTPLLSAKKILRRIYMYTKIKSPIFYMYNHNKHQLYKYAGNVEPLKRNKKIVNIDSSTKGNFNIKKNFKYIVRQIEKKQF